jgi:hypothetical protein
MEIVPMTMPTRWAVMLLLAAARDRLTFDKDTPGKPTAGWPAGHTGRGNAVWISDADPTARLNPACNVTFLDDCSDIT